MLMDTQLLNSRASIRNQLSLTPQPHALSSDALYTMPLTARVPIGLACRWTPSVLPNMLDVP